MNTQDVNLTVNGNTVTADVRPVRATDRTVTTDDGDRLTFGGGTVARAVFVNVAERLHGERRLLAHHRGVSVQVTLEQFEAAFGIELTAPPRAGEAERTEPRTLTLALDPADHDRLDALSRSAGIDVAAAARTVLLHGLAAVERDGMDPEG